MNKLKIGFFIDTYFPMIDGVVNVVDNYAKRMCKFADVIVFCPEHHKKDYNDNFEYQVKRCKSLKFFNYDYNIPFTQFDFKLKKFLKNCNLDIVHIHSPFSIGKLGVKYAKKYNIPCVASLHSQYKQDFYKATHSKFMTNLLVKMIVKVFNACDECWAVNEAVAKLYFEEYKLKELPKVAYNGTDMLPVEDEKLARREINEMFNLQDSQKVFCFVGRLTLLKNILFIADALKLVKDKGFNFKMIYVGNGFDEKTLREKVSKLGLDNDVIFAGKISDREVLKKIYARTDLLLFPSLYDTDGLIKYEGASQHTPTLTLQGIPAGCNIKDGINGYLSKDSIQEFADKIIKIFENKEEYKKVCEGAFKDLYITWDKIVEKSYNEYLRLIKEKKNL